MLYLYHGLSCIAKKKCKAMCLTAHTWFGIHLLSRAPHGAHFQKSCCFLLEIIPVIETSSVSRQSKSSLPLLISAWVLDVSVLSVGRPSVSRWVGFWSPVQEWQEDGVMGRWFGTPSVVMHVLLLIYRSAYVPTIRSEPFES